MHVVSSESCLRLLLGSLMVTSLNLDLRNCPLICVIVLSSQLLAFTVNVPLIILTYIVNKSDYSYKMHFTLRRLIFCKPHVDLTDFASRMST